MIKKDIKRLNVQIYLFIAHVELYDENILVLITPLWYMLLLP